MNLSIPVRHSRPGTAGVEDRSVVTELARGPGATERYHTERKYQRLVSIECGWRTRRKSGVVVDSSIDTAETVVSPSGLEWEYRGKSSIGKVYVTLHRSQLSGTSETFYYKKK